MISCLACRRIVLAFVTAAAVAGQFVSLGVEAEFGVGGGVGGRASSVSAQEKQPVASEKQPAASEKPKPAERLPMFNGRDLDGWRTPDKFFFEKAGKVEWKNDQMLLGVGKPGTAIAWTREMPRSNYEVTLEAKRTGGDDFFCGMTFPVKQQHCTLILGGWGGGTTGLSNINDFAAIENETTDYIEFKRDKWYFVRLKVTDKKIQAWVDEKQIVDVDTEEKRFGIWWEQEPVLPFGIATWNTSAALRRLSVRRVGEK